MIREFLRRNWVQAATESNITMRALELPPQEEEKRYASVLDPRHAAQLEELVRHPLGPLPTFG
jgi:hypothetical protein